MEFKNIDGIFNITIDNQTIPLQMKEIIRENTFFTINKSLNTPLYSNVEIDLLLERSHQTDIDIENTSIDEVNYIDEEEPQETLVVESGSVYLVIRDINTNYIYDQKKINFYNGIIQTQMTNSLSIGDYLFEIYYFGNKYYEPTTLTVYFSVEKREVKCIFDNEYIEGYPLENINFGATLKDSLTDIPISNCKVDYSFNNTNYTTQTDNKGYVTFNITMPSVNQNRCFKTIEEDETDTNTEYINEDDEYYIDEDGNLQYVTNIYTNNNIDSETEGDESTFINDDTTTENLDFEVEIVQNYYDDEEEDIEDTSHDTNAMYKVNITINDNVYYSNEDIVAYVHSKMVDTEISFSAIANNLGIIHIEGDVVSKDENVTGNVEYGKIIPTITNISIDKNYEVDDFGHFDINIPMPSPQDSQIQPSDLTDYQIEIPTKTILTSNTESTISRDWAEDHYVDFTAKVQAGYIPVTWSMVTFILSKGNNEVYRYVTELNSEGEAFFSFNVSTLGIFKVKAIYHGMFGYLTSTSETITYTVTEKS